MIKMAMAQLNSKEDYNENLKVIHELAMKAHDQGASYLFLPECFYSMSDGTRPTQFLVDKQNEHYQNIKKIAIDNKIALIGGSAATKLGNNVVNRAFNFSEKGVDLGHYDKMNLFSCDLEKDGKKKSIDEADIYTAGLDSCLLNLGELKVGLGICFDLRYPEIARKYVRSGANLLTYSSAFTIPTGQAHWHTLIRARAIENQCFVVASAQVGRHNDRIQTYGHSLVVDPWGEVLVDLKEEVGVQSFEVDLGRVDHIRKSVKVFK